MAGFDNEVIYGANVDFSGGSPVTGQVTLDGQLLIGSTVSPNIRVGFITGSGGVVVTNGAGTIDIAAAGVGITWQSISASQGLAVNNGYFCVAPGGALTLVLPAVSVQGDEIEIVLDGSTSFVLTQLAGQQVRIGNVATTLGVGGSITSTQQGDSIRLVCQTANLKWNIVSSMGNPTVV